MRCSRLSKDEQLQQRRANQRLGAEVMSQRIREMSDNDPRGGAGHSPG
ncbi:hypothetical protein ACLB1E_19285 [Escherichia coli]